MPQNLHRLISGRIVLLVILSILAASSSSCDFLDDVILGDPGGSSEEAYLAEEPAPGGQDEVQSVGSGSGDLKPVGFVNYGEFDAVVMPYTYVQLGATTQSLPVQTSTVSSANDGVGDWPNTSRFLEVPVGTYSWCIDWEEGDLDEDGQIDYFHYIQNDPTVLDEKDSDELEFAEEVAISAPPSSGTIFEGRCEPAPLIIACTEYNSQVIVHTYLASVSNNPPEILAYTNVADQKPPPGLEIISGGNSTAWGLGMVLWTEGDFVQVTTNNPYSAMGGQIFGDHTIGWARVLFDGVEIWRGDASTYVIQEGAQFGVYVEVTCFPPGTHTLRIECLGIAGSGGGQSIPSGYFGFRE